MTDKQKPAAKAPNAWRGKPHAVDMEYGKMAPIRYPDSASKSFGNWLMGLLTPWKR
jgi:hypothetical protein